MSAIPITLFFSLLLAGTFVLLFAREQRRRFGSAERDSLLPLADEVPLSAPIRDGVPGPDRGDACRCRRGDRTPCAACLRRRDAQDPVHF